jgi:hypothetical protein
MPIHPGQARPEPRCPCLRFYEPLFHRWVLQGHRESRSTTARRCPKQHHGSAAHHKRCQRIPSLFYKPRGGRAVHKCAWAARSYPQRSFSACALPPVMSRTRFPDGIAGVACHEKSCRGMPVTMPLRGPMLPCGTPTGTVGCSVDGPGDFLSAWVAPVAWLWGHDGDQSSGRQTAHSRELETRAAACPGSHGPHGRPSLRFSALELFP